ncbi:tetratricopeptide repeat protein [Persicimonas caeni]|nr:tetratricopeptide repeat protein [Persicimonas caeni]
MSFLDKLSERVGGFLDEVFLPEDVAHALHKASQAMQREDYDAALRILYRTHAEHPDFHRTHHMIGMCHFHQEKFDEALSAFDRAVEQREEAVSHLYAGLSAEQLGNAHEAQVHFRRGLELSDAAELEFDLLFGLGRVYLAQGRADKAVRELKKAVKARPDQSEATVLLARALLQRSKLDEARKVLERPGARSAGQPALILRGEIEEARGHHGQAREAYDKALEWEPNHLIALIGVARTSLALGDHRRANECSLRALEEADEEQLPEIHTLLGRVNEAVENRQRALECYRNALHLDARRPQAHLGAGRILLERGDAETAREHFQGVLEMGGDDPTMRREALVGFAKANLAGGDLAGARRLIDEVLQEQDKPSPEALHLLGQVALESGDPAEAVVAFEEAVRAAGERRVDAVEADLRRALGELTFDWELPERLDDSTDVVEVLRQLRDFVASDPRIDHFSARVQQMLATLNSPLSVAIVGEFNAGKSTLLNALIGEEVVPMGVLPTTAHTCFIQYGPRKSARVVRKDGEVTEVNLEEAKRQMKTDADDIDHLEYVYPHPDLRSVEFWDTPGFNALEDAHEETASRALEEAEAILWVLDANQALSHSEFEQIEKVPNGRERLLVLLNKIDRLGPADSRGPQVEELVDYVEENASARIAGCFPMTAKEALAHRTAPEDEADAEALADTGFEAFRDFLESRIIERSGRIKTLEIARQLHDLVGDMTEFQRALVDKYDQLGGEAASLRGWLDELADERPEKHAKKEARALEDRFDFVLTGIEREIREALKSRGTWLTRKVLSEEDQTFILDLLSERLDDVLNRSRQTILADVDELEGAVAQRVGPIIQSLPLGDARAMNRRLEGFFDETRMLKLLLEERVYGQLRARATGQIEAAGQRALEEIRNSGQEGPAWRAALRRLLPDTRGHLNRELAAWYEEFFLAACRFSDRVQRDLHLLKLEAEHHFDVSAVLQLASD